MNRIPAEFTNQRPIPDNTSSTSLISRLTHPLRNAATQLGGIARSFRSGLQPAGAKRDLIPNAVTRDFATIQGEYRARSECVQSQPDRLNCWLGSDNVETESEIEIEELSLSNTDSDIEIEELSLSDTESSEVSFGRNEQVSERPNREGLNSEML